MMTFGLGQGQGVKEVKRVKRVKRVNMVNRVYRVERVKKVKKEGQESQEGQWVKESEGQDLDFDLYLICISTIFEYYSRERL